MDTAAAGLHDNDETIAIPALANDPKRPSKQLPTAPGSRTHTNTRRRTTKRPKLQKQEKYTHNTWQKVLTTKLTAEEKATIEAATDDLNKRGASMGQIINKNEKLLIHHIIISTNYSGNDRRKSTFKVYTMQEFMNSKCTMQKIINQWDKLSGIAVVECINNRHYQSVVFRPSRMREPLIGYNSRKIYNAYPTTDLMGKACSELGNNEWRQYVEGDKREQERLAQLIKFMDRVTKRADEIRDNSKPTKGIAAIRPISDRNWKVLRTFVTQTDDISCGILTCLFLDCMKNETTMASGRELAGAELEEYRWHIANQCFQHYKYDYDKQNNGETIDLSVD